MSLPLAFHTTLQSIPADVPYLRATAERIAKWAPQLASLRGRRIGIAWQGNPNVERIIWARGRSIPLAALEPLARLDSVSLVSLQKGFGSEQLEAIPFRDRVLELGPDFDQGTDAFLDTAAAIASIDLVITTDTAVAHLAGALGRTTWLLLNATPDWRWLLQRADSPWYPGMRLFRPTTGGWDEVVGDVIAALADY